MSDQEAMTKVVASLDWAADISSAPELGALAEQLRSRLGDGVLRWMLGAVDDSLSTLRKRIHDPLVSQSKIRVLGQHMLINVLLDLTGENAFPTDQRIVDRELASDFVARDIAMSVIVGAFRHMQREWLVRLIDASLAVSADATRLMPDLAESVTKTVDVWVGAMIEAMVRERRRVAKTEQLRVRTSIEALISGAPVDAPAISRLLHLPLTGWHRCCVIGARADHFVDRQQVDVAAWSLSRLTGGSPAVRYETSDGKTYLWTTTENTPAPLSVAALGMSPPHVAAIGEARRGVAGFRRSFVEADDALRLALQTDAGGLNYRDVALAITLSQDEERARWFVEDELGDLAGDSVELRGLRNTLRAFFSTKMRIAPAAERLFVHRNTLIHRLDRIERLIGHPLSERAAELQAALTIAEFHPSGPAERSAEPEPLAHQEI